MTKKEFDLRLKNDALENGITVEGDVVIFDNKSNLDYELVTGLRLRDLLTANPVSLTRLNKNLLVLLDAVSKEFANPLTVIASYHSPEYHLLSFGCSDSDLYTTGNAVSISTTKELLPELVKVCLNVFTVEDGDDLKPIGEVGLYSWGVHLGWTKEQRSWNYSDDLSFKQKVKDFLKNDKMKNIALIGAAAAAVWFFFIKK